MRLRQLTAGHPWQGHTRGGKCVCGHELVSIYHSFARRRKQEGNTGTGFQPGSAVHSGGKSSSSVAAPPPACAALTNAGGSSGTSAPRTAALPPRPPALPPAPAAFSGRSTPAAAPSLAAPATAAASGIVTSRLPVVLERFATAASGRTSAGSTSCSRRPRASRRTNEGCTSAWMAEVSR